MFESKEIVAIIHFRVDRNGRLIVGPEVRAGSSDRRYDDAALRAVLAGQPFPPLPQAYAHAKFLVIRMGADDEDVRHR